MDFFETGTPGVQDAFVAEQLNSLTTCVGTKLFRVFGFLEPKSRRDARREEEGRGEGRERRFASRKEVATLRLGSTLATPRSGCGLRRSVRGGVAQGARQATRGTVRPSVWF